ncbi:hypothetical protein HYC85_030435 [Camellia sinensis]|uniref:Uncharacterized protein n=1 Tax=Camellia sinensis TaxID=4442 RepID=A0A7J7G4L4_CAMSI|nr:hypothetical protein HYC85_030435 [Camellia sinensis]
MANDRPKEKVRDDTPTESGKHIDLGVEEDNYNEETRDKNHREEDVGQKGDVPKKSNRSEYYNEDDLQPPFPSQDTPIPATKKDAQAGGQKTTPTTLQHDRTKEHSYRPSREVGRGESRMGDSQRTHRTKEADSKELRHVQGKDLCFNATNGGRFKRTHNDTGSSAPKKLKSEDSRAPGRTKEDLRNYLQRKRQDAEVTSPVKPR